MERGVRFSLSSSPAFTNKDRTSKRIKTSICFVSQVEEWLPSHLQHFLPAGLHFYLSFECDSNWYVNKTLHFPVPVLVNYASAVLGKKCHANLVLLCKLGGCLHIHMVQYWLLFPGFILNFSVSWSTIVSSFYILFSSNRCNILNCWHVT